MAKTPAKPESPAPPAEPPSLEAAIERLEAIIEELESGEADLEKSIGLFAEGKKIGDAALKRLDQLERKIQVVTGKQGEALQTEDFQPPAR